MLLKELLNLREQLNPFTNRTTIPDLDDLFDLPHLSDYFKTNKDFVSWKIEHMSPDEYIDRVYDAYKHIVIDDGIPLTRNDIINGRSKSLIKKYAKDMENGDKFPIPSLYYRGTRLGQEGLHRALAAKLIGINKIPVMVVHKNVN